MELMQANRQWAIRPADERFTSIPSMLTYTSFVRQHSARRQLPNRALTAVPSGTDDYGLAVSGPDGIPATPTHWGFNQLCNLAKVPASYLRDSRMPAPLAADCLNWGLHHVREVEDVSVLLRKFPDGYDGFQPGTHLAAVNGPDYGVVGNADIVQTVFNNFGNGVDGQFRIPGEFGKAVEPTKDNTTLYASDRDVWMFLADEERRIEVPNRREGRPGSLARGFYISNSEVGSSRLLLGMFLFDYVCCNRIIWGAQDFQEVKIKHTSGAPYRWIEEVKPILREFAESSPVGISETIANARQVKVKGDIAEFLSARFGNKSIVPKIELAFSIDEGMRPMETIWDVVTGATAYARGIPNNDDRVKVERIAGQLLAKAA